MSSSPNTSNIPDIPQVPTVIKTERLILRPWCEEDLEAFARLNADPRVMEFFPKVMAREDSDQSARKIMTLLEQQGWGFWAASIPGQADFIGAIGLAHVSFDAHFTPAVEVGWRLAYDFWNKGYATEGARAALKFGFETLKLDEIVSVTSVNNKRSRRVMEKIGMVHDEKGDFDHPRVPEGHPLRRHVLYRIRTGHFTQIWESPPEHFQAQVEVSACYVEVDGKILLMKRAAHTLEGKTWGVPAGKIEKGESPHQAAVRELFEETGIRALPSNVQEVGKLYIQKPRGMCLFHVFQVHMQDIPEIHLSHEHTEYMWTSLQDRDHLHLVGGGKEALQYFLQMTGRST